MYLGKGTFLSRSDEDHFQLPHASRAIGGQFLLYLITPFVKLYLGLLFLFSSFKLCLQTALLQTAREVKINAVLPLFEKQHRRRWAYSAYAVIIRCLATLRERFCSLQVRAIAILLQFFHFFNPVKKGH